MMIKATWLLPLLMAVPVFTLNMSFLNNFSSSIQMIHNLNSAVKKNQNISATTQLVTSILKLMSLDDTKLAAAAINALIFLAQLLASSLMKSKLINLENVREDMDHENSFKWIIDDLQVTQIMPDLLDPKLPEMAVEYAKERSFHSSNTGCVEMLICKISPFIWTMQKVLKSADFNDAGNKTFDLYSNFPTREELKKRSDECSLSLNSCF